MIRTGIIGYGLSGRVFHAPLISTLEGMALTSIASSRTEEILSRYPETKTCTADELINDPDIDLVIITSPNDTHFPLARQALMQGKHVVLEKPMVMNVAEGEELIALAKQQKQLLSVYHNCRWNADFLTIQKLLNENRIGKLHTYKANFHRYKKSTRVAWKNEKDSGGILYDLASHLVDQALMLFGWPQQISSDIQVRYPENNACDYFNLRLYYPCLIVELNSDTRITQAGPRYELHGHDASYLKYGLDSQEKQLSDGMIPEDPGFGIDPTEGVIYFPGMEQPEKFPNEIGRHVSFYQQLKQAITHEEHLPVTAEQGLNVIRLLSLLEANSGKGITSV